MGRYAPTQTEISAKNSDLYGAEQEYLHSALTAKVIWMIVLNIGSIDNEEEK